MGRKNKEIKHPILRKIGKAILILLLLVVIFIGGFVGYSTYKNGWGWTGLLKTALGSTEQSPEELGELQILILGVSKDISVELTDTIMVASYNPATQKATLLSIPRDTFIGSSRLRATSYDKINAVYQKDGAEGTLEKVNKLTGLNIKYYMVISNNALVELVDEIGGVQFDVPDNMDYDSRAQDLHIHLKKGLQKLNGEQAEGLVRFRKNNNGTTYSGTHEKDDFGRMQTQREFLKAVAKQTLKAENITKIGELIDIVKKNVKTNIKDWTEVKAYIPYAVEFDTDNIQNATIPGDSARIPAGTGLWFFLADETKTKTEVEELFLTQNAKEEEDTESENTTKSSNTTSTNTSATNTTNSSSNSSSTKTTSTENSKIKIELLNGSGDKVLLTKATDALKSKGYNVYKTGTTSSTATTTIINKSDLSEDIMSNIKSVLKTGVVSSSSSSSNVDIKIIIGKDYKG